MIVIDTNILLYLFIENEHTSKAEIVFKKDEQWAAPILWRSEFRNVLAYYMRNRILKFDIAIKIMNEAITLVGDNEYDVSSLDVLRLAQASGCSAYDCEFVALARDIDVPLITSDKKIIKAFPEYAVSLESYAGV
ncbi:PIN domain-containing protein [candidate division KSB1 bacterium]|nr:PIN domain-containing protein [candidate division KSB1 bacterium]